mmetsp:Transcript_24998/g.66086  ORF Transcript_24998/g.66086 Transcript_24998/m.66086 type:complete len:579 (-) Transcript_24998:27-1763(-)
MGGSRWLVKLLLPFAACWAAAAGDVSTWPTWATLRGSQAAGTAAVGIDAMSSEVAPTPAPQPSAPAAQFPTLPPTEPPTQPPTQPPAPEEWGQAPKDWQHISSNMAGLQESPTFSSQHDLDSLVKNFKTVWDPTYRDLPPVPLDGGPLAIGVHMSLVKFQDLDEVAGSISLVIDLMLCWTDQRLSFSSGDVFHSTWSHMGDKLPMTPEMIWTPDIVVKSQISDLENQFASDNSPLVLADEVFQNQTGANVMWTRRINMKSSCDIDMDKFPFDEQKCSVIIGSWASSLRQLTLIPQYSERTQIDEMGSVHTAEFLVRNITVHKSEVYMRTSAMRVEEIQYEIELVRYPHFYVVNFMLPMVAVTMLTIATMWMSQANTRMNSGTRLVLCVVQIMNITAQWRPASDSDIWLDRFQSHCLALSMGAVMQSLCMDYLEKAKVLDLPILQKGLMKKWLNLYVVDTVSRTLICYLGISTFIADLCFLVKAPDASGVFKALHGHSSKFLMGFVYIMFGCLGASSVVSSVWLVLPSASWERLCCRGCAQTMIGGIIRNDSQESLEIQSPTNFHTPAARGMVYPDGYT